VGRDVSAAILGKSLEERTELVYNVTPARIVAVRRGEWELSGRPAQGKGPARALARIDLYRLRAGKKERVPLEEKPEIVAALRPELDAAARRFEVVSKNAPAPAKKDRERLRALGYVD
jgi:hypothetical protein